MGRRPVFGPALPPAMKKARAKAKRSARALTKTQRVQVKKIVRGQAETKMAIWYNGTDGNGFATPANSGKSSQAAADPQNQTISSTLNDCLRILPRITQGVSDNQRIGQTITPVSCRVHCKVSILPQGTSGTGYMGGYSYNLVAVAYCLQHVEFKDYSSLFIGNTFSELLSTGENSTIGFNGNFQEAGLPVEKAYYKLLAKKVFRLRSSGTQAAGVPTPAYEGSNNNAAPMTHEWTWNITKHLPKKIIYPQEAPGFPEDSPTNSAPFWCIGYYNDSGLPYTTAVSAINQQYVTTFKYKDM